MLVFQADFDWSPPCSLSVQVGHSVALRALQTRGRSQKGGGEPRSGPEENKTPPHYLHRGTAGRPGGAVPGESVSRCEHEGGTSTADALEGRKSGGKMNDSVIKRFKHFYFKFKINCIFEIS